MVRDDDPGLPARETFAPPRWLPPWLGGGHLQTIWSARVSRPHPAAPVPLARERWTTPDGDFIDVDFGPPGRPGGDVLVLFHGLEGSSASHYARAFAGEAAARGVQIVLPHFRGCSGELNLAPRAYHSGDYEEVGWILGRLRLRYGRALHAVGVSLGGNALLRWAQEAGDTAAGICAAVAAVSSPLDLTAAGHALGKGFNRHVYARMFLATLKPKALAKWRQHPRLFDRERVLAARDLYEFDNAVTAPLHGFRDTDDYWTRASSRPHLHRVRIPALVLNARNDPFVPASSLPAASDTAPCVTLWQPAHGGHAGFPGGVFPGHLGRLPRAVLDWFASAR